MIIHGRMIKKRADSEQAKFDSVANWCLGIMVGLMIFAGWIAFLRALNHKGTQYEPYTQTEMQDMAEQYEEWEDWHAQQDN